MDTKKEDKMKWVLLGLVSMLVVTVIILGGLMFSMQKQLGAFDGQSIFASQSSKRSESPQSTPDKGVHKKASDAVGSDLDNWLMGSFDPNNWDPFTEMQQMRSHIDQLFSDSFGRFGKSPKYQELVHEPAFAPRLDVHETGDTYVIRVDLPGVDKGNIDVHVDGQNVTISGDRMNAVAQKDKNGHVIREERFSGHFSRTITLPGKVDAGRLKAENNNGVVTVILPKQSSTTEK